MELPNNGMQPTRKNPRAALCRTLYGKRDVPRFNVRFWPEAAVQTSERISTQRLALPDLGSHSRLERDRSPWAIRAAILQHIEWLLWSRIDGWFE